MSHTHCSSLISTWLVYCNWQLLKLKVTIGKIKLMQCQVIEVAFFHSLIYWSKQRSGKPWTNKWDRLSCNSLKCTFNAVSSMKKRISYCIVPTEIISLNRHSSNLIYSITNFVINNILLKQSKNFKKDLTT